MGSMHQQRKEERAKQSNPINFTCGVCDKVVKFQENYLCSNCEDLARETATIDEVGE